jgi:hypothetical protein
MNSSRQLLVVFTVSAVLTVTGTEAGIATAGQPGGAFYDDDTSEHASAIEAIAAAGITRGCNPPLNSRFCPDGHVSRGQMAAFLGRGLSLSDDGRAGFVDTATSVFATDIDRLAAAGITKGCNPPANDRFCPTELVTRGQMAAFLARGLGLAGDPADAFTDDGNSPFEAAINSIAAAGITKGCNPPANDRFCPQQPISRAELATFLLRALRLDEIAAPPRPYQVNVVPRAEWGAQPPRGEFAAHQIETITVHHGGGTGGLRGPELYRSWQRWHFHLGWPDLAYHFIVGRDGTVYEGRPYRAAGDTATEYDPAGHLLFVVEGDFDREDPTAAQLESLAQLVAWGSMYFDAPNIGGHRDHAATTCPGDNLYQHIADGSLAARVTEVISAGGVTLRVADL